MATAERVVGEIVSLLKSVMYVGPALDALPPQELRLMAAEFRSLLVADASSAAERIVGYIGATPSTAHSTQMLPASAAASVTAALRNIVRGYEVRHPT